MFDLKKTFVETFAMIKKGSGDGCPSRTTTHMWWRHFKDGRESFVNDGRIVRLSTRNTRTRLVYARCRFQTLIKTFAHSRKSRISTKKRFVPLLTISRNVEKCASSYETLVAPYSAWVQGSRQLNTFAWQRVSAFGVSFEAVFNK